MTDSELVEQLLENYGEQYRIYQSLLASLNAGIPGPGEPFEMNRVIAVLSNRNSDFDTLRQVDSKVAELKREWERRGTAIHSISAETLRTLLGNIQQILSKVMDANKKIEDLVAAAVKKP